MKIKLLPLIPLLFFIFSYSAKADPIISNITIEPGNPWFGEDVFISCVCYDDNENYTISNVYVDIFGLNITISNWNLDKENETYSDTIDHSYLYRTGEYNVTFYCKNNVSTNATETRTFTVSNLTSYIDDIIPSPAYVGDEIEIDVTVKKDDTILDSGVDFTVSLNAQTKTLKQDPPIYDPSKGWILKIDAPSTTGTYDLDVLAEYGGAETTSSSSIEIKQPLEFELVSIDKTWVKPNDNITLTFQTIFQDSPIDMKDEYLNFWINSIDCSILDISQSGEFSYVKISTPDLSPGTYDFDIRFTYMGFVKDISETIDYVVSVSGNIKGSDDKAIYTQLKFKGNDTEKTFITDGSGSYSGELPPGIYDLELTFPKSKLILTDIMINEFDDPIKYDNPSGDVNIPGIGTGAVFVYEIALTYSDAYLEMKYDDSKIPDETKIIIYKCENWNFGRKVCNADWNTITTEIDTVRNLVKLNTTSLSSFVIGYKKNLKLNFDSDKDEYSLKELIKITGIIEDEDEKPVADVKITASIPDTDISASIKSDNSGVFSLEFQGPSEEGDYTIFVKAEKSPFSTVNQSKSIKLVRSESLSVLIPDSIKIEQGENESMWVTVLNTGQTDFTDLTLSLIGIPEGYYTLPEIEELKAGEEKKVSIDLNIPENADKTSHTGKLKVTYDGSSLEKQFILTILSAEKNLTVSNQTGGFKFPTLSLPTAKIVLPTVGSDVMFVAVLAILSFSIAVLFKRRKYETKFERKDIQNLLLDIKREVETRAIRETRKIKKKKTKRKRKRRKKLRKTRKTK